MKKRIGKKIKDLRMQKGITQEKLAQKLDVDYKTISLWECGKAYPQKQNLIKICEYFNISYDDLLGINRKKKIIRASIIIAIIFILSFIVYLAVPKDIHYQIVSNNPDFEVDGEIIYNRDEKVLRINSVKVVNEEKYQGMRLYDCSYRVGNENGTYFEEATMYGGYDSYDDPTYDFIDSLEKIRVETEIKKEDIEKMGEDSVLTFYYENLNIESDCLYIGIKILK